MKKNKKKTRIMVVDDHPIVRCGLANLLAEEDDLCIGGEAASGAEALAALARDTPDLIILDLSLPDGDGIDICRKIRHRHVHLPILVMSIHSEVLYADRVLRAGADGYIMKHEAPTKIVGAIRQILSGNVHVSPHTVQRMLAKVRGGVSERTDPDLGIGSLTERELQVFSLIGQGRSTREIASELGLGVKTVETHRLSIKKKLDVRHLPDLVKRAVEWTQSMEKAG
jgi:DNA-binding NarL/FixJ family response regulator